MNKVYHFHSSPQTDKLYNFYLYGVWLYVILLIFEGALRKWLLPSLSTPLLFIREPLVIWLVCISITKGWLDYAWVKIMMFTATISLFMSLLFGHHNIFVGIYGWRIYFFHFPMMFIIGRLLCRDDLLRLCRFFILLSIPMTVLIYIQFYSPPTAFVNIGVGGEGTAGFGGIKGFMRPPGTFSFTSGYVCFQSIVGCSLLYYIAVNSYLSISRRLPNWILVIALICYLVAIPTSISRTNFFQSIIFVSFYVLAIVFSPHYRMKIGYSITIIITLIILLGISGLIETNIEVFTKRFTGATKVEGGVEGTLINRYLGGLLYTFIHTDIPIFGYGIGIGTNVGAYLMGGNMYSFGFNGEVEWQRIVGECGFILGTVIIMLRLLFSLKLLQKSWQCLRNNADLLPWMLASGMILCVPQGQWAIATNLGFAILSGGMTLAAIRTSSIKNYKLVTDVKGFA